MLTLFDQHAMNDDKRTLVAATINAAHFDQYYLALLVKNTLQLPTANKNKIEELTCQEIKQYCAYFIRAFLCAYRDDSEKISLLIATLKNEKDRIVGDLVYQKITKIILHSLYPNESNSVILGKLFIPLTPDEFHRFINLPLRKPGILFSDHEPVILQQLFSPDSFRHIKTLNSTSHLKTLTQDLMYLGISLEIREQLNKLLSQLITCALLIGEPPQSSEALVEPHNKFPTALNEIILLCISSVRKIGGTLDDYWQWRSKQTTLFLIQKCENAFHALIELCIDLDSNYCCSSLMLRK